MTHTDIISQLKNRQFHPVYFIYGEEPYYNDLIIEAAEKNIIPEHEKGFNELIFYGKESNANLIRDTAMRYPMMATHQLVMVKEAQYIKDWEPLYSYIENPLQSTVLIISSKQENLDKRTQWYKILNKHALVFQSETVKESKVVAWITAYITQQQKSVMPDAAELLADHLGNNLSKIVNELDKLCLNLQNQKEIKINDVEKYVGISKEFTVFELNKSIAYKNKARSFFITEALIANFKTKPLLLTLAGLFAYFMKIYICHLKNVKSAQEMQMNIGVHPFFSDEYFMAMRNFNKQKTEKILSLISKTDTKSKGIENISYTDAQLLNELIAKIYII